MLYKGRFLEKEKPLTREERKTKERDKVNMKSYA